MLVAIFAIVATITIYVCASQIYQKFSYPLLNPFLITVSLLIVGLLIFDIPYVVYHQGGQWLTFLLEPAIVAFGLPLYLQLKSISRDLLALLLVVGLSALLAIVSTVALAVFLDVDQMLVLSLATHSVTTPIAVAVAIPLGGDGALAAMGVLITGLIGALFGVPLLKLFGIKSAKAQGIAIGVATHVLGTSTIMKHGDTQGAYSALALVLCAIITALLTPLVVPWILSLALN